MWSNIRECLVELCPNVGNVDALRVYLCDTEGISGIIKARFLARGQSSLPIPVWRIAQEWPSKVYGGAHQVKSSIGVSFFGVASHSYASLAVSRGVGVKAAAAIADECFES